MERRRNRRNKFVPMAFSSTCAAMLALSLGRSSSLLARALLMSPISGIGRRSTSSSVAPCSRVTIMNKTRCLFAISSDSQQQTSSSSSSGEKESAEAKIKAKGDEIRSLKESGADKALVGPLITELLALKAAVSSDPASPKKEAATAEEEEQSAVESDFITPRAENYSKWYNDIIRVTGLAEPSPVRGCMVIKPWGMSIWDNIRADLDSRIKRHGAENAYFPLLIPKSFISREAEHVHGFAKECAVVTHHRLTTDPHGGLILDPDAQLEDPLVIRPTSETMVWTMFKKWILSYRDLPLKVNQWANVLRWELRTRPFLRTSEFLWQEGHTAHETADGAIQDARAMIRQYEELCHDLLAMPVVVGLKSPLERFAGAEDTYTIEALMQNGWALQSGTSHFLGQSFGKAFGVTFQDRDGKQQDVWGTSWGASTRLIGALIMTHSDDAGLVLPPKVSPVQVVIVPIQPKKKNVREKAELEKALEDMGNALKFAGLRVKVDDRDYIRNGAKYFEWERKGVPLRIELGPRDLKSGVCIFKYRVGKEEKETISLDNVVEAAVIGLDEMQTYLLETAKERLAAGITKNASYPEMKLALEKDEAGVYPGAGLFLVPWRCNSENEEQIKEECKATIRCYPLDSNDEDGEAMENQTCFYSGTSATHMALFGRAF